MTKAYIISVGIFLLASSCQTPYLEELERKKNQKSTASKIDNEFKQSFVTPGTDAGLFKDAWGEPVLTEHLDGTTAFYYDDPQKPMIFLFKENKLAGWMVNKDEIRRREAQIQNEENLEFQRRQALANSLKQFGNSLQQSGQQYQVPPRAPTSTNCYQVGNSINCNSY